MAANKKLSEEDEVKLKIQRCVKGIICENQRWNHICEFGCNDPYWSDGENMNLIRQHIIKDKKDLMSLCPDDLPKEYYIPTPPLVDENYMAIKGMYFKERTKRIGVDQKVSTKLVDETISLFDEQE